VGRTYAGMLGTIAFATTVARGLIHGSAFQTTATTAVMFLIAFAVVGALIGQLAGWIVADSVRSTIQAETQQTQSS
jgi:hypothetical protein